MRLDRLGDFPVIFERVIQGVPRELWRRRAADGSFALVEHACHIADLEEEGFGVRIERLLFEDAPFLPDFAGEVIARERRYIEQEAMPAAARFRNAREANRQRFLAMDERDWSRRGTQEHVGEVTLDGVLESMLRHDIAHANELLVLLPELGIAVPEDLAELAGREPLARSAS